MPRQARRHTCAFHFLRTDATLFNEVFVRANADISLLTPPLRRLLSPAPRSAIANAWVEQQRFVFSRQRLVADLPHTGLWPLCNPLRWQTSALPLRRQLGHRQPSCCEQTFGVQWQIAAPFPPQNVHHGIVCSLLLANVRHTHGSAGNACSSQRPADFFKFLCQHACILDDAGQPRCWTEWGEVREAWLEVFCRTHCRRGVRCWPSVGWGKRNSHVLRVYLQLRVSWTTFALTLKRRAVLWSLPKRTL